MSIKRFWKWRYIIPAALIGFPLFLTLIAQVVKALWNALVPTIFGLPPITAWQAIGLLVLLRILVGGFGGRGGGHPNRMTREERERLRERMCARRTGDGDVPVKA